MKFTFSSQGQVTDEFSVGSDINNRTNSRFKILHPDLAGSTLSVEQKMSDDTWIVIFVINEDVEENGSVIDSVHGGIYRIKCDIYGGSDVTIYYKE